MCRFTLYLGPDIRLASLLLDPSHSLIRQSTHSREREEPLNGDGFGVGWYARALAGEPAVFRSITPAWNNRNLHNLARVVASDCILAHVRAATQSSGVNEANCHPFRFRQYLFMHNGDVGNFRRVRRRLLDSVCDEAYSNVYGSTDSECFFALCIDELLQQPAGMAADERLASALANALARMAGLVAEHGDGAPSYMNCALSDGENAVVSRYTDDSSDSPESLYYFHGALYPAIVEAAQHDKQLGRHPVIVSSERLTDDDAWTAIPDNTMVVVRRGHGPQLRAIRH
ncbi:MAG: class II glutamine amidotransferase [Proteobacteria bacterium]|nr:class II glutamine amidotransferase [Pseudomonadota bacterium]